MTLAPVSDPVRYVLRFLEHIKPAGGQFNASCPVPGHGKGNGDRNPSLTVGPGRDQPVVVSCKAGCPQPDVLAALADRGVDWTLVSNIRLDQPTGPDRWMPCGHDRVAEYEYRDPAGVLKYGTARCALKGHGCPGFAYWRPDTASRSGRRWRLAEPDPDGIRRRVVPRLLYRLPEVLAAIADDRVVWLVGGEKDAEALARIGIPATCNDGGEGNWSAEYAHWLAGADVVIVADRDATGWKFADRTVETLLPIARSIEVVRAAEGKDTYDHLAAGLKIHQFVSLGAPLPAPLAVPGCPDCVAEGVA